MPRKSPAPPSDAHVQAYILGAMEAAQAAIDALPFRDTPSFEDLFVAIGAVVEFLVTTKPEDMEVAEPEAVEDPATDHDEPHTDA